MTTVPDYIRNSRHPREIDDNGFHQSIVMYAECFSNSPVGGPVNFDFNFFYDLGQNDLSLVIPAGLGLSYSGGTFTATEDGLWLVNISVDMAATPGEDGEVRFIAPTYGSTPKFIVTSAQPASLWTAHLAFPMEIGQDFALRQTMPTVAAADYATLDIIRIGRSVA